MPTIAVFYGIAVQIFYGDHNPPHFHARYGRARALVRISDGEIISGELTPTAARLMGAGATARIEGNWVRGQSHQAMEHIAGLDADERSRVSDG
jgi:hypothetical protein